MSEEFEEVAFQDFTARMTEAVEHFVNLKRRVNDAIDGGDDELTHHAGNEMAAFVTGVSYGAIPMALVSMADRIIEEHDGRMALVDLVTTQIPVIRAAVSALTTKRSDMALMSLLDVANAMAKAVEELE